MKKEVILAIFILILILIITNQTKGITIINKTITGGAVTGKVSIQPTNVSITITGNLPTITILKPENKTYLTNTSLLLNYTSTNADNIWYHIDSLGNTTITSFVYFNTSQGSHTLYLYANNSQGTTKTNVTFTINSDMFTINFSEWAGEYKGNSTNFNYYSFEELQNLSEIIFEDINYGKIYFPESINLTDDFNPNDDIINIDDYINTSFNRIEINSTALPNFNKSATLRLYSLTFTNPRIARNGVVCPSTICTKQSYSGGTLVFNVTHFTSYGAEETPSGGTSSTSTSGGGGGGKTTTQDFSVDIENIKVKLKQGETKKEQIIIKNTGNIETSLSLSLAELGNIIKITQTDFTLKPGEIATPRLEFTAERNLLPDVYVGKVIIKTDAKEKEVTITIEVETKKPLFDVKLEIPEKYLYIQQGEEILARINLLSLEEIGKIDANIKYTIKNWENKEISSEEETFAVEKHIAYTKTMKTPEDIDYGNYIFYIRVTYNGEIASASSWFSIKEKEMPLKDKMLIVTRIFIIAALIFIMYKLIKIERKTKINEAVLIKEGLIKIRKRR